MLANVKQAAASVGASGGLPPVTTPGKGRRNSSGTARRLSKLVLVSDTSIDTAVEKQTMKKFLEKRVRLTNDATKLFIRGLAAQDAPSSHDEPGSPTRNHRHLPPLQKRAISFSSFTELSDQMNQGFAAMRRHSKTASDQQKAVRKQLEILDQFRSMRLTFGGKSNWSKGRRRWHRAFRKIIMSHRVEETRAYLAGLNTSEPEAAAGTEGSASEVTPGAEASGSTAAATSAAASAEVE